MPNQFASSSDSNWPDPIEVKRNQYEDEIPTSDPTNHENATPGHSNPMYTGKHYNDDVSYSGGGSKGPGVSRESVSVKGDAVNRGDES